MKKKLIFGVDPSKGHLLIAKPEMVDEIRRNVDFGYY